MTGTLIGFPCITDELPEGWDQPLTVAQFRVLFPNFTDDTTFPDATIQAWLDMAPLDPCVWGSMYQLGMGLWVGHELTKFGPGGLASAAGAGNGVGGIVQSKSVDSVSLSYDNNIGTDPEAGQYNMTIYGRQFWSMLKYLPIGPIQVGPATIPMRPLAGAWIGPWPFPGPVQSGFSS